MATMTRAMFPDVFSSTAALAFLRQIISSGTKRRPEWFQDVFKMETTDQANEQYTSKANFGLFVETDEGSGVTYDAALQGFDRTLTPLQYSLGFKVTKIAIDDDRKGVFSDQASDLGWGWTESRNVLAADVFNNGFATILGSDGLP